MGQIPHPHPLPTGPSHILPFVYQPPAFHCKETQAVGGQLRRAETEIFVYIKPAALSINFRHIKQTNLKQKTFHWISAFPMYTNNTRGDKQCPSISILLLPDPNRT